MSASICLTQKKILTENEQGKAAKVDGEFNRNHCLLATWSLRHLNLSCLSSQQETKPINASHVTLAFNSSFFHSQNSPRIVYQIQNFELPIHPHCLLYDLAMLLHEFIKLLRFSNLVMGASPVFLFFLHRFILLHSSFFLLILFQNFCPQLL